MRFPLRPGSGTSAPLSPPYKKIDVSWRSHHVRSFLTVIKDQETGETKTSSILLPIVPQHQSCYSSLSNAQAESFLQILRNTLVFPPS